MARPDFPRSLTEFHRMFRTEGDAYDFILQSRWPEEGDWTCPACGGSGTLAAPARLALVCASCRHVQSATAGTVMHGSRLPLQTWLLAAWLLVTDKRGVSAKQLERALGVSYETAYMVLQRLRAAMVHPEREALRGTIEIDETFLGGVKHGRRGLEDVGREGGKFIVLGAVEVRSAGSVDGGRSLRRPARLRLRHARDLSGSGLRSFVKDVAAPGSSIVTDGREAYAALVRHGYSHTVESATTGLPPKAVLRHLHLAFSNLKAWMKGTFHGAVEAKHLQGYLNEFCFRFNRRENLFAAFQTLLAITPLVEAPSYERIYAEGAGRFLHVRDGSTIGSCPSTTPAPVVVQVYPTR